ncbi:MAG: hypothetical protein KDB23_19455 [Planctomycetales bacterium]|nr:hypothetical protein [Planctomycetales bacterium]
MASRNKRKKVIVHKQIQLTLVRRLMLHWGIFVAVTCLVATFIQFLMDPLQSKDEVAYRFRLTVGTMLLVAGCLAPIFIRDTIRLSHRVVGPLIRLRRAFQEVEPGAVAGRIALRKTDYWQELIADYNAMLERLDLPANETEVEDGGENAPATVDATA